MNDTCTLINHQTWQPALQGMLPIVRQRLEKAFAAMHAHIKLATGVSSWFMLLHHVDLCRRMCWRPSGRGWRRTLLLCTFSGLNQQLYPHDMLLYHLDLCCRMCWQPSGRGWRRLWQPCISPSGPSQPQLSPLRPPTSKPACLAGPCACCTTAPSLMASCPAGQYSLELPCKADLSTAE